jgi:amino acid transporter
LSLKKFHILFITLATLCFVGFGAWCFAQPEESGSLLLAFAIMSVLLGLFTAVYGVWFYRNKIKQSEEGTPAPAQ